MDIEYEVKILDIDIKNVFSKLDSAAAKKKGEKIQRRYVYDFSPKSENSWIRLRTDGKKTTLTIKEIHSDKIDGTQETEIIVDDFEKTNLILEKLGYKARSYQENKRISYSLEKSKIEIDFWPKIPPYLEIEGESSDDVMNALKLLGYSPSDTTCINTMEVYEKYGLDINSFKNLMLENSE
ncbi:MAG: class IV adenylate cyclase [Nanobdellota archaeon]